MQMIGARNRLIYGYDSVDFDILWMIIFDDLPGLIRQLKSILAMNERCLPYSTTLTQRARIKSDVRV